LTALNLGQIYILVEKYNKTLNKLINIGASITKRDGRNVH
jgi:hypothetical protein